jgi:putative transposase
MDESRLMLTDEVWGRMAAAMAAVKSRAGAPPKLSDREFVEAVLHVARTGEPWRDLPARFGKWDAVYQRFLRWEKSGWWRALFAILPADLAGVETLLLDSSVVRAHPHAAGALKKKEVKRRRPWAAAGVGSGPRSTWPLPTRRRPSPSC